MPVFEYYCPDCKAEFEELQRQGAPCAPCPKCKGPPAVRIMSASSFSLKGGGWATDGYAKAKGAS